MTEEARRTLTDEQRSVLSQCLWDMNLTPYEFFAIIEGRGHLWEGMIHYRP
jgi:hypothetical protein